MPSLQLPGRFQNPPFFGDYYRIFGLSNNPSKAEIMDAYRAMAIQYHPDKIETSSVQPPLTIEEATACFQAIAEMKSILLSNCAGITHEAVGMDRPASAREEIRSAEQLSPGEQLKAVMLAYLRSARFCDYPPGKGPGVPGYWAYIPGGKNAIEQGTSRFSNKYAIATPQYHAEFGSGWEQPLVVYDKSTKPFTIVSDNHVLRTVLEMMADSIPKGHRDFCAKIYGSHVCESKSPVITAGESTSSLANSRQIEPPKRAIAPAKVTGTDMLQQLLGQLIKKTPDQNKVIKLEAMNTWVTEHNGSITDRQKQVVMAFLRDICSLTGHSPEFFSSSDEILSVYNQAAKANVVDMDAVNLIGFDARELANIYTAEDLVEPIEARVNQLNTFFNP